MDRTLRVLDYLKKNGPCLPVEVSKAVGQDVLFTSAILAGLMSTGQVRMSAKKIGNSSVYYVPGQEDSVKSVIYSKLSEREKELVERVKNKGFVKASLLSPAERYFAEGLTDFFEKVERGDGAYWKFSGFQGDFEKEVKEEKVVVEKSKAEQEKLEQAPVKLDKADDDFTSRVKDFFIKRKIRILEKNVIRAGSEADFVVEVQSDLVPQKYFVKSRKKKTINEKDLTMAWFEGRKHRMPMLFISNGKLTKKAEKFLQDELGESVKFVKVKL
jgi:hypothetical protein